MNGEQKERALDKDFNSFILTAERGKMALDKINLLLMGHDIKFF